MTMQETFREFSFEAAHQTPPFSTLHGHSFRVLVTLHGEFDPVFQAEGCTVSRQPELTHA